MIDRADLTLLDAADRRPQPRGVGQAPLRLGPGRGASGHDLPALAQLGDRADERPPFDALDQRHVGGQIAAGNPGLVDPDELRPEQISVADPELGAEACRARDALALHDLAGQDLAIVERESKEVGRPEVSQGVDHDDADQAGHHDEGQGQRSAGEPDEGLAAAPESAPGAHRTRYLRRRRSRTTSAAVLTAKVSANSSNAAMNSTRKRVPPSGASGSSTAMLAESARKPLKIEPSITGVFPVAIRTIMVSPTARPKPIMIAEKIPGLAVGRTTRSAVCQRVAPRASEPARRCWGTLASESSAIVKMIGITANPMATPTTSELRWSYVRPRTDCSQFR